MLCLIPAIINQWAAALCWGSERHLVCQIVKKLFIYLFIFGSFVVDFTLYVFVKEIISLTENLYSIAPVK